MEKVENCDDVLTKLIGDDAETVHGQPRCDDPFGLSAEETSAWSDRWRKIPTKRIVIFSVLFGVFSSVIILFFTVFLPIMIQDSVDDCHVDAVQAVLMYPGNASFSTETTIKMSGAVPLPASLQFKQLTIRWNQAGGGDIVALQHSNRIRVTAAERTLRATAVVKDAAALSAMMSNALDNASYYWDLRGSADVTALISVNVDVDKSVRMKGYNGFPYPPTVNNFSVTDGTPTILYAAANSTLTTDATTALIFGQDVYFSAEYNGHRIGTGVIPDAAFHTGTFEFLSTLECFYKTNEERRALMQLMSSYIQGHNSSVVLNHFYLSPPVSWLIKPLHDITMTSIIPGVDSPVVQQFDLYIYLPNPLHIDFTLDAYNPVDVEMTIIKVVGDVYYQGTLVGLVNDVNIRVVIPPKRVVTSGLLYAEIVPGQIPLVVQLAEAGFGYLDIHTVITCYLDKYEINITYSQYNVSSYVHEGLPNNSINYKASLS